MENEYLSDDENKDIKEEEELTFEEMYPEEELDDETLKIIYSNNVSEINFNDFSISKDKKKDKKKDKVKDKEKENNIISLKELSQRFEEKKVEKWTSKRIESKKIDSIKKPEPRYKFNPRLPAFNTIYKEYNNEKKNTITIDNTNFPSL